MDVALFIPAHLVPSVSPVSGTVVLPYQTVLDLVVSLRATTNPAVIWSDDLADDAIEAAGAAVRDHPAPCIEVRSEKWDGQTYSALSAACKGVISGFGAGGVAAAAALLRDS